VSIVCIFWWQLRQSHPPAGDTISPAYNIRLSGLFCSRSDVLELTCPDTCVTRHILMLFFWTITKKNFFLRVTSVHSALATMPYINWCFTYLLTYLHCNPYETAKLPQFPHTVSPRTTICDSSWYSNRIVIEFKSNINRIAYIRITVCTYLPSGLRRFGPVERKDDTDCIKRCMPLSWMN